jgi:hypothetical protein
MKFLTIPAILLLLGFLGSCSSPEEKREDRQEEARQEYDDSIDESEEKYQDDKKDEAQGMVEGADEVKTDKDKGRIDVED